MNININQEDFWTFLRNEIGIDEYQHKFLRQDITRILKGEQEASGESFFNVQGNGWILIVHSDALLIYGNNWSESQFEEIKRSFDLNEFEDYYVQGESGLINALINYYGIENCLIEKERILYRTTQIVKFQLEKVRIRNANFEDKDILAGMLQQYYHEEYDGHNDKNLSEMKDRVQEHINNKSMYVLEIDNAIASFCTVINPDIGILFTQQMYRNRGYGKQILSYCSNIILENNDTVFLMTDRSKTESNAAAKSIGYQGFYDYLSIGINNTNRIDDYERRPTN